MEKFLRNQRFAMGWTAMVGHIKKMDDERAPEKAKRFVVDGSKKVMYSKTRWKKKWKEVVDKCMLARRLKKIDAQDRARLRFDCKNWPTPACMEQQAGSRKMDILAKTPRINR